MRFNKAALLAWVYCGVLAAVALVKVGSEVSSGKAGNVLQVAATLVWGLGPIVFASVGALIVSYQPRNMIGWLMMLPPSVMSLEAVIGYMIRPLSTTPPVVPISLVVAVWLSNAVWLGLIFPLLFIALLFPNGSPPSPRWRWVVGYGVALILFFVVLAGLAREVAPDPATYGVNWVIPNPIGFISQDRLNAIFFPWWVVALGIFTILSVTSLGVRYRRAGSVAREQIKWLLYACVIFAAVYVPGLLSQTTISDLGNLALGLAILTFPIAVGIAVLRYRLWDINVVIRKTLVFTALTALLALVYFGSVVLLQELFGRVAGVEQSPLAVVVSTLLIAALFTPLRSRLQHTIDRHFFRSKYDAQQVLAQFAQSARNETDLDALTGELVEVVRETLQPAHVNVWLRRPNRIEF